MDKRMEEVLSKPVEDCNFCLRASRCLKELNIHTLGELTEDELLYKAIGLGRNTLRDIKEVLAEHWSTVRDEV